MKKTYTYKVYDQLGNYIKDLNDVVLEPTYTQEINSAGSELKLQLGRSLDEIGEEVDISFGNIVKIYVTDKEATAELFFQGRIVNYAPYYGETESLDVTLYSLGYELDYIIFKTTETLEQEQNTGSSEIVIGPDNKVAQSFIPDQPTLTSMRIKAKTEITSTTITLRIKEDSGGEPASTALVTTSNAIVNTTAEILTFNLDTPVTLTVGDTYWLEVEAS